jgi:hypothetical protein
VTFVEMRTVNGGVQAGRWRTEIVSAAGCDFTVDLQAQ